MFTISESVRITQSQDGAILLDVERGAMFTLNPVGTRILELLRQRHSFTSVVARISEEFGAPGELVQGDVDEFLSALRELRLLKEGAA